MDRIVGAAVIGTIIGVLAFIALIAGLTYAWFTWTSGNTILGGTTECFTINYVNGQNISERNHHDPDSFQKR